MPATKNQFHRARIIDREITRHKSVSTHQLKQAIEREMGITVTDRTIQMDIAAMRTGRLFALEVPIESVGGHHRYTESGFSLARFGLTDDEVAALQFYAARLRAYRGYSVFSDFEKAIEKVIVGVKVRRQLVPRREIREIIQTDTGGSIEGTAFIEKIVSAIDEYVELSFSYNSYQHTREGKRVLHPYVLREYRHRWYVVRYNPLVNGIKTYALDRKDSVDYTGGRFERVEDFDADRYFEHTFGITRTNDEPVDVELQYSAQSAPYVKSLPIYHSQKVVSESSEGITISIRVIPCYELYEYILSKGPDVRVLSPASVVQSVKDRLVVALQQY